MLNLKSLPNPIPQSRSVMFHTAVISSLSYSLFDPIEHDLVLESFQLDVSTPDPTSIFKGKYLTVPAPFLEGLLLNTNSPSSIQEVFLLLASPSASAPLPCLSFWASLASRFLYVSHVLVYIEGLSALDPIPLVRLLLGFGFPVFLLDRLTCLNGPPLLQLPVVILVLQISVRYNS